MASSSGLTRLSRLTLPVALALLLAAPQQSPPAGSRLVELELVLGVDTSMSVAPDEFTLQMVGYAQAFRDPQVVHAIQSHGDAGIAVTLVQWPTATSRR